MVRCFSIRPHKLIITSVDYTLNALTFIHTQKTMYENKLIIYHHQILYLFYFVTKLYLNFFPNRGFPRLLSWLIVAKYQTEIKIGRINLWRLSFEDVLIKKSGLSIVSFQFLFSQSRYRHIS